jgi:7tm Odorant receptor
MAPTPEVEIFQVILWPIKALKMCSFDFLPSPPDTTRRQKIISAAKKVYFTFVCVSCILMLFSQFINLLNSHQSFENSLIATGVMLYGFVVQTKLYSFLQNKKTIIKIFTLFERVDSSGLNIKTIEANNRQIGKYQKVKIFRVMAISWTTLVLCFGPIIKYWFTGIWYHELVWKFWLPFDKYNKNYYNFVFWWMNWNIMNVSILFFATDMLIYGLVLTASIEFNNLSFDVKEALDWNGNLSPLIERHIKITQNVKQINKMFSKTFILNFLVSSYLLCASAYMISTSEDFSDFSRFASVFLAHFSQIAVLCFIGNLIESSSQEIFNAIQASKWYEDNKKVKFGALMMTMRSRKACELKAWKFVSLNFSTLMIILNTAYSYYTCLKSL